MIGADSSLSREQNSHFHIRVAYTLRLSLLNLGWIFQPPISVLSAGYMPCYIMQSPHQALRRKLLEHLSANSLLPSKSMVSKLPYTALASTQSLKVGIQ